MNRRAGTGIFALLLLICSTLASPARAEDRADGASSAAAQPAPAIPRNRLYLADLSIIRWNPLGLETQNRLVFQHRLMDRDSLLFRDNFVSAAVSLKLNPAYFKVGPIFELQPIALLNLRAGYELVSYFGSLGYLQSYPDSTGDYSDDARAAIEDTAYATRGTHLFLETTLQAKVKRVAVRSKLGLEQWNLQLREGDTVFYDATLDTLVPGTGWVITNDSDLLYVAGKLTAGLRFSGVWPRYNDTQAPTDYVPSHQRLGPLLAYTFNPRDYSGFNKPTLLLITGWYLNHPNRTGGVPYILLGFSFTSDFLKHR